MSKRATPALDPVTLRWVADELTARAKKWARWASHAKARHVLQSDGKLVSMLQPSPPRADEWEGGAEAMRTYAKAMRACATRIERKRRRAA